MSNQIMQCGKCGARQTFEDIQFGDRYMNHISFFSNGDFTATCLSCYRIITHGNVENVEQYICAQQQYKAKARENERKKKHRCHF